MSVGGYMVVARNPATASENRIHSDEVARQHGFRGGLVPGVTVYAYAVHQIVEVLGPDWIQSGGARVRFRAPCYEGEQLTVDMTPEEAGRAAVSVSVDGEERVTGEVTSSPDGEVVEVDDPAAPSSERRPPASPETLAPGTTLGSIRLPTDAATTAEYLAKVGESSPLYEARGWVHPGLLLEGANWVLMANVILPPWLHVESDIRHVRAVEVGEAAVVRARVAEEFERRGHRFVALDVAWTVGSETVAAARQTAIWSLAER